MDTQNSHGKPEAKSAAVGALAVAGFLALVILGISLAIYSARFVPTAVSKITSASHVATTTTLYTNNATTTPTLPFSPIVVTQPENIATATKQTITVAPPITHTSSSYTHTSSARPAYYGLPDLSVQVTSVGFLAGNSTDSFVPATVIPAGAHPAIKFIVTNIGTNVSQPWSFSANIPSATGPMFNSSVEQPLGPGDHINFTLSFNQTVPDPQVVSVVVDPNNQIVESTKTNNYTSATIQVAN